MREGSLPRRMVRWTLPMPTVCGGGVVVLVVVENEAVVARDAVERVVLHARANRIMLVGVLGSCVLKAQFLGACVQVRWWWWKGQVRC